MKYGLIIVTLVLSFLFLSGSAINESLDGELINQNDLDKRMKGIWIATFFPDSIRQNKEVMKWQGSLYGDMIIKINDDNIFEIFGNMDGIDLPFKIIDSKTIEAKTELGKYIVTYSGKDNLLYLGTDKSRPYRKTDIETVKLVSDEKALMKYVIDELFTTDYLPQEMINKIDFIALGLDTMAPFSFDAIGLKNDEGKLEYFAWEFENDKLILYKTIPIYDDDSGSISYKIGKLDRVYAKRK